MDLAKKYNSNPNTQYTVAIAHVLLPYFKIYLWKNHCKKCDNWLKGNSVCGECGDISE